MAILTAMIIALVGFIFRMMIQVKGKNLFKYKNKMRINIEFFLNI